MKTILAVGLLFLLACVSAEAQGTFYFSNRHTVTDPATGEVYTLVNAPVFINEDPILGPQYLASGNRYQAQLYWTSPNRNEFVPAGSPVGFLDGPMAGYFDGGAMAIPGVPPGGAIDVRVIAWDSLTGELYARPGTIMGASDTFRLTLGGDPFGSPSPLVGLTPFLINHYIPEPSPLALGLGGLAVFWVSRRFLFRRSG